MKKALATLGICAVSALGLAACGNYPSTQRITSYYDQTTTQQP